MKKGLHSVIMCLAVLVCHGQDIHWSQPSNALIYINPAFTAIEGRYNANLNFRDQWSAAGKAYKTYMAAGDYRLGNPGRSYVGIGGLISSDMSGDGRYKTTSAGITLACLVRTGKNSRFGIGAGANYVQNALSDDIYSWGNQFDGNNYNSTLPSGETQGGASHHFLDLNAGASFIYDEEKTSIAGTKHRKFMVGYSVSHYNRPVMALTGSNDKLLMKQTLYMRGLLPINDRFAFVPMVLGYYQGVLLEATGGGLFRFILGQTSKITGNRKGSAFSVGALYRYHDAIIPTIELEKGTMIIGLSYDVNISSFSSATKLRGGPELVLRLRPVKEPFAEKRRPPKKKKGVRWF